jgi:hypothetical protein
MVSSMVVNVRRLACNFFIAPAAEGLSYTTSTPVLTCRVPRCSSVTLGPKLSETVKGKLSLGARILQAGGVERVFRLAFSAEKGERLVKALQCYLYTTGGPIAGMLFVSTRKIAFRSDRSLAVTSPAGEVVARVPYKVVVPLRMIKRVRPSEDAEKPEKKYIQVVTVDGFEFWFIGFVSYQRCRKYMQQVISEL